MRPLLEALARLAEDEGAGMIARRLVGVVCPSEILREELDARGWSIQDLAQRMPHANDHELGINMVTIEMYLAIGMTTLGARMGKLADELAVAFDVDPSFWRNLESAWLANAVEIKEDGVL